VSIITLNTFLLTSLSSFLAGQIDVISRTQILKSTSFQNAATKQLGRRKNGYKLEPVKTHQRGPHCSKTRKPPKSEGSVSTIQLKAPSGSDPSDFRIIISHYQSGIRLQARVWGKNLNPPPPPLPLNRTGHLMCLPEFGDGVQVQSSRSDEGSKGQSTSQRRVRRPGSQ
jgi:hypothetical protein